MYKLEYEMWETNSHFEMEFSVYRTVPIVEENDVSAVETARTVMSEDTEKCGDVEYPAQIRASVLYDPSSNILFDNRPIPPDREAEGAEDRKLITWRRAL